MDLIQIILGLGFIFISLVWRFTDPRNFIQRWTDILERQLKYSIVSYTVILISLLWYRFFKWPETKLDIIFISFGFFLYYLGLLICIWAKIAMKKSWGIPAQFDPKRQSMLIQKGPFKFSRNPIYLGIIIALLGFSIALRSMLLPVIVGLAIWYFNRAVKKEEKLLEKTFGKSYLEYKKKVPKYI